MKVKLLKIIIFIFILAVVSVISYIYVIPFIINTYERYVNPSEKTDINPNVVDSFTPQLAGESFDGQWRWNILQGVVDSYGTQNGIDYVKVTYFDFNNKEQSAKVMIRLTEDVMKKFEIYNNYDANDKTKFKNRWTNTISFYESDIRGTDPEKGLTIMDIDDFKKLFNEETLLIFKIASNMPNLSDRNKDYCTKNIGLDKCLYADMVEHFAPDWSDLWKVGTVKEESILVPYSILSSIEEINEKTK